jgi:chromosomal replication initiator protein
MDTWEKVLQHIAPRINPHSYATWFRPTQLVEVQGDRLTVRVPNRLFKKKLRENYGALLAVALAELHLGPRQIEFVTEEPPVPASPTPGSGPRLPGQAGQPGSTMQQSKLDFESVENQLNPRYTFDSFVVGSSNQFAHAAALAVAERPSKAYNPLFLYGGVGMGKTHLMQAIGHLIKHRQPTIRVTYISSEEFTNEVINSLRYDRMFSFREKYRHVDVLLVDDIEFIAGKERTQEEFFHTFNALYDAQRQIVLSSDCPPKEIAALEERLRSRFEWGLIADIQPPDLETKIAILMRKAETESVKLPPEVAEYIARSIKSNVRELEGALIRLQAYGSLIGEEINLPLAQRVLKNIIDSQEKKVTIELIQKRVGEQFGLRVAELKSKNNSKAIAYPRQIAMYLAKHLTQASLPEIGRQFGNKHHTTVLHSVNKIEALRREDKELNRMLNKLVDSFS